MSGQSGKTTAKVEALLTRATQEAGAGRWQVAEGLTEQARAQAPQHPWCPFILGNIALEQGHFEKAQQAFEAALALQPVFPEAHNSLALLHQRQGQLIAARRCYEAALAQRPNYAAAHANLGTVHRELGNVEPAIKHYQAAIAVEANRVTLRNLAALLERANRVEEAQTVATRLLAQDPKDPAARLTLARLRRLQGDSDGAKAAYEGLRRDLSGAGQAADPLILARVEADLGQIAEKTLDWDLAYRHYDSANRLNREAHPNWRQDCEQYRATLQDLSDELEELRGKTWPPLAPDSDRESLADPLFLVGFPRSGTTLLDQILGSLPAAQILEEKPQVDELRNELSGDEQTQVRSLAATDTAQRQRLRRHYQMALMDYLEAPDKAAPLIDKLPLNLLNLWLIRAVFPDAPIVVVLRDPRDVCLSCFTTLFRHRAGVASFPTIEHTVELYTAVMDLWQRQEEFLDLKTITLRYEDLVEDFEPQSRALLAQLGISWDDRVLRFHEEARRRFIVTPSYEQVAQPLYGTSVGRWKRFEAQLAPILPRLQPYVERFGYEL